MGGAYGLDTPRGMPRGGHAQGGARAPQPLPLNTPLVHLIIKWRTNIEIIIALYAFSYTNTYIAALLRVSSNLNHRTAHIYLYAQMYRYLRFNLLNMVSSNLCNINIFGKKSRNLSTRLSCVNCESAQSARELAGKCKLF